MTEREQSEEKLNQRTAIRRDFAHLILDVLETATDKVEAVREVCKGFTQKEPEGPDYTKLTQ